MTSLRPAVAFKEFDQLAAQADQNAALDWLDRWRERFLAHRDPLTRARYLLRCGALRETRQPVPALIDDLIAAMQVFHALQQPREMVQALARIACWYHRLRLLAPALASGELALSRPELPQADRLALLVNMTLHLAQARLLPEAWDTLLQAEALQPASAQDRLQLLGVRAVVHAVEVVRARGIASIYGADLGPGAEDAGRARQALAAGTACLQACQPVLGSALPASLVHIQAIYAALQGDAAEVQRLLDQQAGRDRTALARFLTLYGRGWCWRVLGRPAQALAVLEEALGLLPLLDATRLEAQISHELALCHEAMGDEAAALVWWRAERRAQAVMQQQAHRALRRLADLLGQRGWPGRLAGLSPAAAPAAPPAPPGLARPVSSAQADLLARASAHYLAQLPRRVPYPRLAEGLGVSLRTLQLAARRQADASLGELLRRALMQHALTLLCQVDEPMAEVARRLGYADAGSLSRDVRRQFGCTPSQLRAGLARPWAQPAGGVAQRLADRKAHMPGSAPGADKV